MGRGGKGRGRGGKEEEGGGGGGGERVQETRSPHFGHRINGILSSARQASAVEFGVTLGPYAILMPSWDYLDAISATMLFVLSGPLLSCYKPQITFRIAPTTYLYLSYLRLGTTDYLRLPPTTDYYQLLPASTYELPPATLPQTIHISMALLQDGLGVNKRAKEKNTSRHV